MKITPIITLLAAAGSLLLCSCQTATVESRIQEHQQIFTSLPAESQAKVATGSIAEGMHKDAVFLAWGAPAGRTVGGSGGATTETWVYRTMEPVMRNRIGIGYRSSWGGGIRHGHHRSYGCRSGGYGHFSYAPTISYVSRDAAKVVFKNDRVVSWQERG